MRWDDVQIFLGVAREGSLSGAARALGLNHSTVYRRLRGLEDALRVRLFERDGGRYTLTEAGRQALPLADGVEVAMLSLRRSVEGHDTTPAGPAHLTAPESMLPLLAPHIAPFREAFPQIDLQVTFSDRFLDLGRREADVALRPSPHPDEHLIGRRVAALSWAVYAPAGLPEATCRGLPWGIFSEELSHLRAWRWHRQRHGDEPVLLSVNTVPAMRGVICAAGCRGLLPCFIGDSYPMVRRVEGPIPEAESALWLLTHPSLRGNARVRAITEHFWPALRALAPLLEGQSVSPVSGVG